ncbi:MAG: NAD(P)H-binding protein [Pseudonocardia sp.]|nr:NAD(P)H-binding protein [Pseudonocardia sp.]
MTNTQHASEPQPNLVVGGTGKTGRRVADRLTARGFPVRIGSRTGEPAFDWADEATWRPALCGASSAYLAYLPEIGSSGAAAAVGTFARLAVDSGVRRLVLLSGRGSEHARQAELALAGSGAEWAVVRSSWLAQNFDEGFFADAVRSGTLAFPGGAVAEPFISADDVADIAVAALTDDRHLGRVYEVTGPRLLSFGDAVAEISRAAGRTVRYLSVSFDEFAASLLRSGVPAPAVAETVEVFRAVLDGRNAALTGDVEETLGRPATDFADYARTAAAAGAWRATNRRHR